MINWLANPARFMRFSSTALPLCGWGAALAIVIGLYWSLVVAPPDYQQGDTRADHVYPCSGSMDGAERLPVHCRRQRRCARVAASARRDRGARRRTDRCRVYACLPCNGVALGPADVGNVVGLGRPVDLGADPVFSLSRLYRAGERV